jgi:methyl-accepting chemotaxis protein
MVAGESGVGRYAIQGRDKFAGYAPVQGTQWRMALTAPDRSVRQVDQMQWILLAAAALLAVLSAFVAFFIANRIVKPIRPMVRAAEKFAVGDLDVEIDVRHNNEIGMLGRAFQTVSANMSELIASIRSAAEQVAVGSRQIASSGMSLAQGATQQASALEELSASVEQLSSQTRMNAKSASEANDLVVAARSLAERGNGKMHDMLKAMEDIDHSPATSTGSSR